MPTVRNVSGRRRTVPGVIDAIEPDETAEVSEQDADALAQQPANWQKIETEPDAGHNDTEEQS